VTKKAPRKPVDRKTGTLFGYNISAHIKKKTIKHPPKMSYLLLIAAVVLVYFIMFKYVIAHAELEDKI
jgi:hypothetical protein